MEGTILVAGGAGYIGSHMVSLLTQSGRRALALDNLSQGSRDAVPAAQLIVCDLADRAALDAVFQMTPVAAVMHFAGLIQVGESVASPGKYYDSNVGNTLALLEAMVRHKVPHFIFSSTAAIFGQPRYLPIDERHPTVPINPYGYSKWMVEQILADFDRAHGMKAVCLRYFNAAGADAGSMGMLGERHDPETHLIPLVLQAASGRRPAITIYGDDYDTPDGTCVRDYVHVQDLCDAHLLALNALQAGAPSARYNLGNGNGHSIRDVVTAAERVTGRHIIQIDAARRPGDPAVLVADSSMAKEHLRWRPRFADLDRIISDAWQWERHCAANEAERTGSH